MSETIIKLENISKQYRLGQVGTNTIRGDLQRWWYKMRGKEDPTLKIGSSNQLNTIEGEYVWALRDINLEVKQGEVLGIIGKNGAGKSTLLKLLSRVTAPTTGNIKVKGRIASLLEVGTGFHPDLTGRENIFLNGAIMGMNKAEVKSKFDEIVDFAGVAKYVDTPVKRYSSGMYVRLGFAVAAYLEPDILIVDEVLAVGDAEFQKKAIGKMQQISHRHGRTVLFVSHNMSTIRNLCETGMFISNGAIQYLGTATKAINLYEENINTKTEAFWENNEVKTFSARLKRIELKNTKHELQNEFLNSDDIFIHMYIECFEPIKNVKIGFDLLRDGIVVFRTQQVDYCEYTSFEKNKSYELIGTIPGNFLNHGEYQIRPLFSIHCIESLTSVFEPVITFNVIVDSRNSPYHSYINVNTHPGSVFPILKWLVT